MIVIPAIDLMDGKAVRLSQGQRNRVTTYATDPAALAARFAQDGAKLIHIVDLDGAFAERPEQRETVRELVAAAAQHGAGVQTGGGIRDEATVDALLDTGVQRVVIGTLAVRDPAMAAAICKRHCAKIVVAADARDGKVAVSGWREQSQVDATELAKQAEGWGAAAILYTEVSRDGMQQGPDVAATATLQQQLSIPVYASGGVGSLEHLEDCKRAEIRGVIVGKALYEGAFSLKEALATC